MKENELQVVNTINDKDGIRLVLNDGSSAIMPFSSFPQATEHRSGLMNLEYVLKGKKNLILYFTNLDVPGFLCKTNISRNSPSMFILRIFINTYSDTPPVMALIQGYMYSTGLMSVRVTYLGERLALYVLEIDDSLYFYFPKYHNFMTYYVELLCSSNYHYFIESEPIEKPNTSTIEIKLT